MEGVLPSAADPAGGVPHFLKHQPLHHLSLSATTHLHQAVHLDDHHVLRRAQPGPPGDDLRATAAHGNGEEVGVLALSRLNISRLIVRVSVTVWRGGLGGLIRFITGLGSTVNIH